MATSAAINTSTGNTPTSRAVSAWSTIRHGKKCRPSSSNDHTPNSIGVRPRSLRFFRYSVTLNRRPDQWQLKQSRSRTRPAKPAGWRFSIRPVRCGTSPPGSFGLSRRPLISRSPSRPTPPRRATIRRPSTSRHSTRRPPRSTTCCKPSNSPAARLIWPT
uniref:Uncharacterized protein n=1 Tax=uncultured marine virus TaxID=186617 RepID=A0A0F7LB78_9VIRU|nr:hypothetical protein [uncultured marine virus]